MHMRICILCSKWTQLHIQPFGKQNKSQICGCFESVPQFWAMHSWILAWLGAPIPNILEQLPYIPSMGTHNPYSYLPKYWGPKTYMFHGFWSFGVQRLEDYLFNACFHKD